MRRISGLKIFIPDDLRRNVWPIVNSRKNCEWISHYPQGKVRKRKFKFFYDFELFFRFAVYFLVVCRWMPLCAPLAIRDRLNAPIFTAIWMAVVWEFWNRWKKFAMADNAETNADKVPSVIGTPTTETPRTATWPTTVPWSTKLAKLVELRKKYNLSPNKKKPFFIDLRPIFFDRFRT